MAVIALGESKNDSSYRTIQVNKDGKVRLAPEDMKEIANMMVEELRTQRTKVPVHVLTEDMIGSTEEDLKANRIYEYRVEENNGHVYIIGQCIKDRFDSEFARIHTFCTSIPTGAGIVHRFKQ